MPPTCPYINQNGIRCGQPANHGEWGHGNGFLTTLLDEWRLPPSPKSLNLQESTPAQARAEVAGKVGKEWELKEGEQQCFWQGIHGRCILRYGHFAAGVAHREMEHP